MISWVDKWGATHTLTDEAAAKELKALYDAWPMGLEEIEASIEGHRRLLINHRDEIRNLEWQVQAGRTQ